jgi:hypothetical protein
MRRLARTAALSGFLLLGWVGCETTYPEVVVVNMTGEHILLKNVSFSGCVWPDVLAYGEATSPGRCLPGSDRIHFQKLDTESYCRQQAEDGTIEDVCLCDPDTPPEEEGAIDDGLIDEEPNWFNYQTVSVKRVDYGDFQLFEITSSDMEQDFSVPGPYGH